MLQSSKFWSDIAGQQTCLFIDPDKMYQSAFKSDNFFERYRIHRLRRFKVTGNLDIRWKKWMSNFTQI